MLGAPGAPGGPGTHPPSDPGIAAATVDEMLDAERELLERFKYCYGCDAATFEHDIVRAIRAYASYFNVLPATADNFFCGAGGLFRLGLEVAFFALQGTDAHIVSGRATISVRKELEPRWRQATFLAGLCSELHRTLGHGAACRPRATPVPMARRLFAPGPLAMASGTQPRPKASEVMTMARSRARTACSAASFTAMPARRCSIATDGRTREGRA
jgi:hypothetical protein